MSLEKVAERIRWQLDGRSRVRDESLAISREAIRTCANSIRAAHRLETDRAREMLRGVGESLSELSDALVGYPEIYHAGYVHDCQKEYAEACAFLAVISGEPFPEPEALRVEPAAYLNGLGECIGEMRRRTLDLMRRGEIPAAESMLAAMDEIYHILVTIDYPDALTGGLRRTTDGARGIIEKTRGELTTAIRQDELRRVIERALIEIGPGATALPPVQASPSEQETE